MSRYPVLLLALAALWGASYLFIKVGVEGGFSPSAFMAGRTGIAAAALIGFLAVTLGWRRALRELGRAWRPCLVLGLLNASLPFWLIAWGEQHIDSGVAAIAQSTVAIFSVPLGLPFLRHERIGPARIAGLAIGVAGVGVLVGVDPRGGSAATVGTLAVVGASALYALGGIYGQVQVTGTPGPVLAAGSLLAGFVMLAPFGAFHLPGDRPGTDAIISLVALGLACTAVAHLIMFRAIRLFGARRQSLVTYLIPPFALCYGVVFLDERVGVSALGGLALILAGVALGSGSVRLSGRRLKATR